MSTKVDALLIHGWAGGPTKNWFPWLHHELERAGFSVLAPQLPDAIRPKLAAWLRVLTQYRNRIGSQTVILGHSLGGLTALHFLAATKLRVRACVLTSTPLTSRFSKPNIIAFRDFFVRPIPWETIRAHVGQFAVIHAEDDPVVPFDHGMRYAEILGIPLTSLAHGGHLDGKRYPILKKVALGLLSGRS